MAFIALPDAGRRGRRAWVVAIGGPAPKAWDEVLAGLGLEAVHVTQPHAQSDGAEDDDTIAIFDEETRPPGSVATTWSPRLPDDGLVLLWHAGGYSAAIDLLAALEPAHLRSRVVICAPDTPTTDVGAQVRERGGLTWWRAPWASWVVSLALDALQRLPAAGMLAPAQALERLQRDARVRPRRFLATVADAARQALGQSDRASERGAALISVLPNPHRCNQSVQDVPASIRARLHHVAALRELGESRAALEMARDVVASQEGSHGAAWGYAQLMLGWALVSNDDIEGGKAAHRAALERLARHRS